MGSQLASPRRALSSTGCRAPQISITGTDTHVGKTVVTGLLLHHLRQAGANALALKPFATGDRADARWLNGLQREAALSLDQVNPFFYRLPVAPMVAARLENRRVSLASALAAIAAARQRCDVLLVEGCGGLLAPLGEQYTLLELMPAIRARIIVVAANRLGVINQARLTFERLAGLAGARLRLVLVDPSPPGPDDASCRSNLSVLRELLAPVPVGAIPYLGARPHSLRSWTRHREALATALAGLAELAGS